MHRRQAIVWLDGEDELEDLAIDGPARVLHLAGGLLVWGSLEDRPSQGSRSPRTFGRAPDGSWRELQDRDTSRLPPAPPGQVFLVERPSRRVWTAPEPETWPAIGEALELPAPVLPAPRATLPSWRVELRPTEVPSTRDGVLFRGEEAARLCRALRSLPPAALVELRRGAAGASGWIWARRGLEDHFPRLGRPLLNLGSALEPVLVPANRAPTPALAASELRRVFGLDEGVGLLWWDQPDGQQRSLVFRPRDLGRVTREQVLAGKW